jgi:hypothetical protein
MIGIDKIWLRIEAYQGEKFYQIKGGEFTYVVDMGHVKPDRTLQQIPKSHFEKALALVPLANTVPLQKKFRGPSFIYSILMDNRIRKSDW